MSEELKNEQIETQEPATVEEPETNPTETKTFTQEELDKILADRIARERKKLEKFADYDEIKTKASEYEKALEEKRLAELSEKERADELAKKAQEERDQYAKQLAELQNTIKAEKIRNAFITKAQAEGISYIDDAYRLADLSSVDLDEEGSVVGIDDVVKALVDSKPFLVGQAKPKLIGGEGTNKQHDKSEKTAEQLLAEAYEKAKKSGRPEDRIAYNKLKIELGK